MPFKILYKEIISHYEPITKAILEKLESIADAKDKIKYLKSEEIKYLIDVSMNPSLMNASAILTTANPHKAGLDRWIELKIKEIEINNESLSVKKNKTINSYVWQSNPDNELPELYSLMTLTYKLIAPETTYEQFKAVFTGQPIVEIVPIKWHQDNASELLYFIVKLEESSNIVHNPIRADYKKMTACFVKPDGEFFEAVWKSLKTVIDINLSSDKQKAIDALVNNF